MKGQAYGIELFAGQNIIVAMQSGEQQQQASPTSSTNVPISTMLAAPARRLSRYHLQRHLLRNNLTVTKTSNTMVTSKHNIRRHPLQQAHPQHHHHHQYHQQCNHKYRHPHQHQRHPQRPRVIRASEYKNLRQVVPSLRRQRDVGKVEVVTEAARYIDHLHKTLIERFVLCGIPNSLKDILGTDNANELNSQHIMNLVTNMAGKQRQQAPVESSSISASRNIPTRVRGICSKVAPAKRALYVPNYHHHHHSHSHQVDSKTKPNTNTSVQCISSPALEDVANLASGHSFRKNLPVVVEKPSVSVENGNHVAPNESTKND